MSKLLQLPLGVDPEQQISGIADARLQQRQHEVVRRRHAEIQIDRAEHRLEEIRQRRRPPRTVVLLAAPDLEVISQPEPPRPLRERALAGERRPQLGQLPFGGLRTAPEKEFGLDDLQHRVAQKFQPLVVVVYAVLDRVGAVHEGFGEVRSLTGQPQLPRQFPCFVHSSAPMLRYLMRKRSARARLRAS